MANRSPCGQSSKQPSYHWLTKGAEKQGARQESRAAETHFLAAANAGKHQKSLLDCQPKTDSELGISESLPHPPCQQSPLAVSEETALPALLLWFCHGLGLVQQFGFPACPVGSESFLFGESGLDVGFEAGTQDCGSPNSSKELQNLPPNLLVSILGSAQIW